MHAAMVDCRKSVDPLDVPPMRSPQSLHTALARRFAHRSVVEIGTRNGDGLSCFAQVAACARAVELVLEGHYRSGVMQGSVLRSVEGVWGSVSEGSTLSTSQEAKKTPQLR